MPSSGSSSPRVTSTRTPTSLVTASSDEGSSESTGPARSVEIERKYDADDETPLPDWSDLPGVASVGVSEVRELDARYLDTHDLALARAGHALRRRSGGPDEGWHIKGPASDGGRLELHWPLGEDAPEGSVPPVPPEMVTTLLTVLDAADAGGVADTGADALELLARIENRRTAYALLAEDGGVVAEFVDDRVRATDERTHTVRSWREWEIELGAAGPTDADGRNLFFRAVERAVFAAGGRAAASASKLARALG